MLGCSIVPPLQAEFREHYHDVMELVHLCLASGSRVQRSVLEVALRIVLEAEYRRSAPVPQVGAFALQPTWLDVW
jgi:hypothetical protein